MKLTSKEVAFLAEQYPDRTSVSLFANIRTDMDGSEAQSLEQKGIYSNGRLTGAAGEIMEVVARAKNSARLVLQDKYVFVEKYVYRVGDKLVLVENDGGMLAFSPLVDMDKVIFEIAEFTGMSLLKTVDLEIALPPEEMMVLLIMVDCYRKNTLLFHAGEADLVEGISLGQFAEVMENPGKNSMTQMLVSNYGYVMPTRTRVEGILKQLVAKGHAEKGKGYSLESDLEIFARNALLPDTMVLTEVLQSDSAGEVFVGGGLGVCAGLRDIAFFIFEKDVVELSTVTGRRLIEIIENFLKCPDIVKAEDVVEDIVEEEIKPVTANKFCIQCGSKLESRAAFCTNCGNKVE